MEYLQDKNVILASKSPRRKELLGALGISFTVETKEVDESFPPIMRGAAAALYIANKKAEAFRLRHENDILITADTIVCLEDKILGKPKDHGEAFAMLKSLSGKTHEVITAVTLKTISKSRSFHESTMVHFNELDDQHIGYYIEHYQPYDKAGAYGIQEWIGAVAVDRIEGSYTNVMGLPTAKLYKELLRIAGK